jgi:CubicO group peptidase (beta-lactamase class C family)
MAVGHRIIEVLQRGLEGGVFPGAVALVRRGGKIVFFEHVGHRSLMPEPMPMAKDTIFDLASLTKVFATVPTIMKLVDQGRIALDDPLSKLIPSAKLSDKKELTLRLLLTHSAGLIDWKPFYEKLRDEPLKERKRLLRQWIVEEPFAYEPGKGSLYSDLGFMLLEWVIEEKTGESLPEFVEKHFYGPLGLKRTFFSPSPLSPPARGGEDKGRGDNPPRPPFTKGEKDPLPQPLPREEGRTLDSRSRFSRGQASFSGSDKPLFASNERNYSKEEFAATEDCPWRKRVLQGEVHDDNAWTLGGYSGHAGLFSTAEEIYVIAEMFREHYLGERNDFFKPGTVREFFRRQDIVKGSDWALGWDTRALEGSSAGKYFSRDSVGHTGFTGTSIWMDLEKDVIAILLTNRVHPKRDNDKIKQFRPVFHDTVMEELGETNA